MTNPDPEINNAPVLSEEERAAVFAKSYAARSAGGAPRFGKAPIPPKFVLFVALAFLVLGVGGVIFEHYYGNVGQPSSSTTTVFKLPATPVTPSGPQLTASTRVLMGLKDIATAQASNFSLVDQHDHAWSLVGARGRVVVLTFMSANCNDICTVLGPEIREAQSLLSSSSNRVIFAIVNTDPNNFRFRPNPLALSVPALSSSTNVHFLTGTLAELNSVWINYGVSVRVGALPSEIAHNNVMYFITPKGRLKSLAVPFGNENHSGVFSLNPQTMHRFAEGVAATAVRLAK
jgi:cytochrome oxidase Cu insertion factor (SCO1/SenC/PrrC family)